MHYKNLQNEISAKMKYGNDIDIKKHTFFNHPFLHILIVLVIGFIAYSNTFSVPFQWDEGLFIEDNPIVMEPGYFLTPSGAAALEHYEMFMRRYLTYLSFALNYAIHGYDVTGYHFVNLSIHLANALLVYFLVVLFFQTPFLRDSEVHSGSASRYIALFTSILFVSHPLQTMAVTYIYQRSASLVTFFFLLSLVSYLYAMTVRRKGIRYTAFFIGLLSAVCAMKTKENAFTLPVIIFLSDFFLFPEPIKKRIPRLLPFALTMLIIPYTLFSLNIHVGDIRAEADALLARPNLLPTWAYLFTQFTVLLTYLRLLLLPVNQSILYDYHIAVSFFEPNVILSFLFLLMFFLLGVYLFLISRIMKKELRLIAFGIFWFFICHIVESGIIPLTITIQEHRMYLPSIGVFLALTLSAFIVLKKLNIVRYALVPLAVIIPLALVVATYNRNAVWQSKETLWEDVVRKAPRNAIAYSNLGTVYFEHGLIDKALQTFETALSINPVSADIHYNLCQIYLRKDLIEEATGHCHISVRLKPDNFKMHYALGILYRQRGQIDEAVKYFNHSLRLNPFWANGYNQLGTIYAIKGEKDTAILYLEKAIALKPAYAQAHYNLGLAYLSKKFVDKADREFRIALGLSYDDAKKGLLLIEKIRQEKKE